MKHLHFVQSLDHASGAGLGASARGLNGGLRAIGEASRLVSTGAEPWSVEGIDVFRRRGPRAAFFSPELARRARSLVLSSDALHGHGFYVFPNLLLPAIARPNGIPLVYHPHGMLEPWALRRSRRKKQVAVSLFECRNFRGARLWRALTRREELQIRQMGVTAPIVVAPNGVDVPGPIANAGTSPEWDRPTLLYLGRLHPVKGLPMLLEAWDAMGFRKHDWRLVIAGPDELRHRRELETAVGQRQLVDSVRFVGPVPYDRRWDVLAAAQAFVLPSSAEGFPVAPLEAMAVGLPVVVTRESNIPQVEEAGAGFVCDANPSSIEEALETLFGCSEAELRSMGESGRGLVATSFSWDSIAQTITDACSATFQT